MRQIRRKLLGLAEELGKEHCRSSDWALAVRGSVARGDVTPYSDLDLVLIGKRRPVIRIRDRPCQVGGVRGISVLGMSSNPGSMLTFDLAHSFTLVDSRFVFGNRQTFYDFKLNGWRHLCRTRASELADLRATEKREDDLGLDLEWPFDVQRGNGGLLDNSFSRLLMLRSLHRGSATPSDLEVALDSLYWVLALLKFDIATRAAAPSRSSRWIYREDEPVLDETAGSHCLSRDFVATARQLQLLVSIRQVRDVIEEEIGR